jgi:hypothetical protein
MIKIRSGKERMLIFILILSPFTCQASKIMLFGLLKPKLPTLPSTPIILNSHRNRHRQEELASVQDSQGSNIKEAIRR